MPDTTARDQLAGELLGVLAVASSFPERAQVRLIGQDMRQLAERCADAIIAAGWRPPVRTVTTVEGLDALAVGTVVVEGDHTTPDDTGLGFSVVPGVFHRFPNGWYVVAGHGPRDIPLPVTVLWTPEEGVGE